MRIFSCLLLFIAALSIPGCKKGRSKPASAYSFFQWGEYLLYYEKYDSAFLMFNRATSTAKDSIEKSRAYHYMGAMQRKVGDFYGAQESYTSALRPLNENDKLHRDIIATIDNSLGNTSLDLKRYDEAIRFYNRGLSYATRKDTVLEIMNGKATALQKKENYDDAITIYDSILQLQPTEKMLLARVISNRARTMWLRDPNFNPLDDYRLALQIRAEGQDDRGLNASYAHIADYYLNKRPDSALYYANKMYEKAKEIHSPDDILEAIDKLIRLNHEPASKEKWYEQFKNLNDSLQVSRDTTRSRFALIKYDVQKSKADNLLLQQRIIRQKIILISSTGLAVFIIIFLAIWYNRRRKRIKQEAENAIRDANLKTSQKVHDVVANGLYNIMNELEHDKFTDNETLISRIEELYERSRNISYEDIESNYDDYDSQIHELLNKFSGEEIKVYIIGNQPAFWNRVSAKQKSELLLVLNEIMVNMKKHSGGTSVVVEFKQDKKTGIIHYKDNGRGFPHEFAFGNGLKNTVSRIKSLNGESNFGKTELGGATITIKFPLESDNL